MKENKILLRYVYMMGIILICVSCQSLNRAINSDKSYYSLKIENNKCSPFLEYGLQIKYIDFKTTVPKPWKKLGGADRYLYCFFYRSGEAIFIKTNYYKKYTRGDSVRYYVTNRPIDEYSSGNEVLYDNNYIQQKDTSYIPNEEQLLYLLSMLYYDGIWIEKNSKIRPNRKYLYYRKSFADILLFNIKPKNFERFYKVITSYEELDQPDGW